MAYQISTFFAIYFVVWWLALFLTLPFGIRSQREEGEEIAAQIPGAPSMPGMARKLIWTTILSAVFFAGGMSAYYAGYLNIEWLSKLMGFPI